MAQFVVCPTCEGKGTHVNPAVDGHGITSDEMDDLGPDFFEDYMSGTYDVRCQECGGNRVVPGCKYRDCQRATEKSQEWCYDHAPADCREEIDDDYAYAAERRAELRWGY